MRILNSKQLGVKNIIKQLREKRSKAEDVRQAVEKILAEVKKKGDSALFELTKRFNSVDLKNLRVDDAEIKDAYNLVDYRTISALKKAKRNIEKFHLSTVRKMESPVETVPGVTIWREFRPIEKVGLYIPGGKATYPSTVLMLAIPAKLAGCDEVIMCAPPAEDGKIAPVILVAADLCGVSKIFKAGGAQAIAAMAYGTETIPKVYKIFGPGNQYVTTAKMIVSQFGETAIDMPAGPSEIEIIADETANPAWVAADLLSQLEHAEDSQAVLVAFSEKFVQEVICEMKRQMKNLPREKIIVKSFQKSFAIVVESVDEAVEITNEYAPEHLEIACRNESRILKKVMNVGSVFLGNYSSEPIGDYAAGSNHTLPTSGFAKMFSPLSVESFGKMIQVQKISQKGIANLKETVETLASCEGLDAHKNSVTIRFL